MRFYTGLCTGKGGENETAVSACVAFECETADNVNNNTETLDQLINQ